MKKIGKKDPVAIPKNQSQGEEMGDDRGFTVDLDNFDNMSETLGEDYNGLYDPEFGRAYWDGASSEDRISGLPSTKRELGADMVDQLESAAYEQKRKKKI